MSEKDLFYFYDPKNLLSKKFYDKLEEIEKELEEIRRKEREQELAEYERNRHRSKYFKNSLRK